MLPQAYYSACRLYTSFECLISQLGMTLYKPGYHCVLHVKHANCMLLASQITLSFATAIIILIICSRRLWLIIIVQHVMLLCMHQYHHYWHTFGSIFSWLPLGCTPAYSFCQFVCASLYWIIISPESRPRNIIMTMYSNCVLSNYTSVHCTFE